MGIRLVVVDDNPHVSWEGRVHPVNATFQQFVAGLLDLPGSPVSSVTSCVPLRAATAAPATLPLDERIRVIGTAPFEGIEGYVRSWRHMMAANRPILRAAISDADLVWIKVPASNAALAAALAARAGVPRFVWVAGSATDVARARFHGADLIAATAIGLGYDLAGRLAGVGGERIVVGRELVTSLVDIDELRDPTARSWPADPARLRFAWAGRVAAGKGLEGLIGELAGLRNALAPRDVDLVVIGDGPAHAALQGQAEANGLTDVVRFTGYVADRRPYLDTLAEADAFVFPSGAEGFPKVVLDAMAVGLPVLARPVGSLRDLGGEPYVTLTDLVSTVTRLDAGGSGRDGWAGVAQRGHAYARAHTRAAELDRLVQRWRTNWPTLPWGEASG